MGGSLEEFPDRYRIGSAVELIPIDSPQILILGRHDSAWSPVGRRYYDAAREKSDLVRLVEAPESGHFEMVDPDSTTWPLVRKAALDLAGT